MGRKKKLPEDYAKEHEEEFEVRVVWKELLGLGDNSIKVPESALVCKFCDTFVKPKGSRISEHLISARHNEMKKRALGKIGTDLSFIPNLQLKLEQQSKYILGLVRTLALSGITQPAAITILLNFIKTQKGCSSLDLETGSIRTVIENYLPIVFNNYLYREVTPLLRGHRLNIFIDNMIDINNIPGIAFYAQYYDAVNERHQELLLDISPLPVCNSGVIAAYTTCLVQKFEILWSDISTISVASLTDIGKLAGQLKRFNPHVVVFLSFAPQLSEACINSMATCLPNSHQFVYLLSVILASNPGLSRKYFQSWANSGENLSKAILPPKVNPDDILSWTTAAELILSIWSHVRAFCEASRDLPEFSIIKHTLGDLEQLHFDLVRLVNYLSPVCVIVKALSHGMVSDKLNGIMTRTLVEISCVDPTVQSKANKENDRSFILGDNNLAPTTPSKQNTPPPTSQHSLPATSSPTSQHPLPTSSHSPTNTNIFMRGTYTTASTNPQLSTATVTHTPTAPAVQSTSSIFSQISNTSDQFNEPNSISDSGRYLDTALTDTLLGSYNLISQPMTFASSSNTNNTDILCSPLGQFQPSVSSIPYPKPTVQTILQQGTQPINPMRLPNITNIQSKSYRDLINAFLCPDRTDLLKSLDLSSTGIQNSMSLSDSSVAIPPISAPLLPPVSALTAPFNTNLRGPSLSPPSFERTHVPATGSVPTSSFYLQTPSSPKTINDSPIKQEPEHERSENLDSSELSNFCKLFKERLSGLLAGSYQTNILGNDSFFDRLSAFNPTPTGERTYSYPKMQYFEPILRVFCSGEWNMEKREALNHELEAYFKFISTTQLNTDSASYWKLLKTALPNLGNAVLNSLGIVTGRSSPIKKLAVQQAIEDPQVNLSFDNVVRLCIMNHNRHIVN